MPRADGTSPAQLMFGFRQNFGLADFHSHQAFTDRDEASQKRREAQQTQTNSFNSRSKDLPPLQVNDSVRIQDKNTGSWDNTGTISDTLQDGRSYIVADGHGNLTKRNRRHLRLNTSTHS